MSRHRGNRTPAAGLVHFVRFFGTIGAGGVVSSSDPAPGGVGPPAAAGAFGAALLVSPGPLMMLGFFWMVLGSLPFSMSTSAGSASGAVACWPGTWPVTIWLMPWRNDIRATRSGFFSLAT